MPLSLPGREKRKQVGMVFVGCENGPELQK